MSIIVKRRLDRFNADIGASADPLATIAGLYQDLEVLHPFTDGTSRTNHLILNKLLTENGFCPVILNEPSAPSTSSADLVMALVQGMNARADVVAEALQRPPRYKPQSEMLEDVAMDAKVDEFMRSGKLRGGPKKDDKGGGPKKDDKGGGDKDASGGGGKSAASGGKSAAAGKGVPKWFRK
jgi:hypothetical protein